MVEIGRRTFVVGAAATVGIGALGFNVGGQAVAAYDDSFIAGSHISLRALAWVDSSLAVALMAIGDQDVSVRKMRLEQNRLVYHGPEIARLTVGQGAVAVGVSPITGAILILKTSVSSIRSYRESRALDFGMREFLNAENVQLKGMQTSGHNLVTISQIFPEVILLNDKGGILSRFSPHKRWKSQFSERHYEPLSVHFFSNRLFILFIASDDLETNISNRLVGVEMSPEDGQMIAFHELSRFDGHSILGVETVDLDGARVAVLLNEQGSRVRTIYVNLENGGTKESLVPVSRFGSTRRLFAHDRISSTGRQNTWVLEILPGQFVIESDRGVEL